MTNNVKMRDSALSAIKRYLKKSTDDAFVMDSETISSYIQLLNEQWARFNQAQEAVELSCGPETLTAEEGTREQGETWYSTALANFMRVRNGFTQSAPTATSVTAAIRLPKMELPTFTGDSTEWAPFHDAFQSLVHTNSSLTKSQKLHYLRSCLKGEALHIISSFQICDAYYDEAWDLLTSRFKVMRIIVDGHFRAMSAINKAGSDTAAEIKCVLDPTLQHIRALKALGRPVEFWDDWLVHHIVGKLAFETRKQWELSLEDDDPPTFEQLKTFLEIRCRSLSVLSTAVDPPKKTYTKNTKKFTNVLHAVEEYSVKCSHCNGDHKIYNCERFLSLGCEERTQFIRESGACLNCLSKGHYKTRCRSDSKCRICHLRHHTLIHPAADTTNSRNSVHAAVPVATTVAESVANAKTASNPNDSPALFASPATSDKPAVDCKHTSFEATRATIKNESQYTTSKAVLLSTAMVIIKDYSGRWQPARVLFDTGSHASFITESCAQRLRLPRRSSSVIVTGIGSANGGRTKGEVTLSLSSKYSSQIFKINALILSKISNDLPTSNVPVFDWPHLKDLSLADSQFMKSRAIDILIGVDEMDKFIIPEIRKGPPGAPIAQNTVLGWTLFGQVDASAPSRQNTLSLHSDAQLTHTVCKLWELEEAPRKKYLTTEEKYCEDHFESNLLRASDGRFIVKLPLKSDIPLGESRSLAVRSLLRMEKKLSSNPKLRQEYNRFMDELVKMDHMEEVLDSDSSDKCYYMPHHSVVKESSVTTKLRVVFNASAKTTTGYSLNDALMVGPQLQPTLFSTLIRFRMHRYALNADVAKMYRQVYVSKEHIDLQRVVWRSDPALPIKDYRMLRVTYGVAAASHLAVKALQQTAKDSIGRYDKAASVILRDFYMDDLLTGSSNIEELKLIQRDVSTVLASGGFELRQWASNCPVLTASIPNASKEISHYIAEGKEVHALGLIWNTEGDYLTFSVNLNDASPVLSKRAYLSDSSVLFDPLGLLSPCTIKSKIWFQDLWRSNIDWDDSVPMTIARDWYNHREQLKLFSDLKLERWTGIGLRGAHTQFHLFADASERAYAAVIYARTIQPSGDITVALLSSKTKVAPLKVTTLPRLELCAANLAAKLAKTVMDSLPNQSYPMFAWSDSTITLAWLQAHPSRWSTFIANRVADTQEVLPAESWNHVRSEINPADCASRGLTPQELMAHQLWWNGPDFLRNSEEFWKLKSPTIHTTNLELRASKLSAHVVSSNEQWSVLSKFSSYSKLKRTIAYVLRFINNVRAARTKSYGKKSGPLLWNEITDAEDALIRYTQNYYFVNEISHCRDQTPIPLKSSLLRLQPFLDGNGILRVGGRLKHALLRSDRKHPILLPKTSPIARLLIAEIHIVTMHGGPQVMLTILQRRFWVISARNLVRKLYRKCVKCTRLNHKTIAQGMGDLPASRVNFARCFLRSAVDFAGPYVYKFSNGRGAKSIKGYICSFICMSSGAMHLELVSDLSSASFLNAFKRFINRRGFCKVVYSDNGTNFIGAEKEMRVMFERCMADEKVSSFFADSSISWKFNPPSAPHMGGYWEIGIKRIKYHLKRVLGDQLLTYEEFSTLLTEVEACVNSRPLCSYAASPSDLEILTPGHFIVGEPLKSLPEPDIPEFRGNLHQRWHAISLMRQHFWKRWRDEYLVNLQRRTKWFRTSPNLVENDIVVVLNEATPPTKWKLARVLKCHPGADGQVRVVTVKTAEGELVRPVVKLCLLPTKGDLFLDEAS